MTRPTDQLTLRGFDSKLKRRLVELARARDLSLNRAALLLMRRGAGLERHPVAEVDDSSTIGSALDGFIGVWSEEDEEEFLRAIEGLDRIDPELWR